MKLDDYLVRVKARCEKATKGPWGVDHENLHEVYSGCILIAEINTGSEDTALILHARTDVGVLVKMVDLLNSRVYHDMTCEVVCTGECDCGFVHLQKNLEALVPEEKP